MHALVISEQGAAVHAEGDLLVLYRGKSVLRRTRVREIDQVVLLGRIEVTSGTMSLLLRRGVDLVLLTQNGRFRGRLCGRNSKNVLLRVTQYERSGDIEFAMRIARAIVSAKIKHQRGSYFVGVPTVVFNRRKGTVTEEMGEDEKPIRRCASSLLLWHLKSPFDLLLAQIHQRLGKNLRNGASGVPGPIGTRCRRKSQIRDEEPQMDFEVTDKK